MDRRGTKIEFRNSKNQLMMVRDFTLDDDDLS